MAAVTTIVTMVMGLVPQMRSQPSTKARQRSMLTMPSANMDGIQTNRFIDRS